jgi:hypothetical protein
MDSMEIPQGFHGIHENPFGWENRNSHGVHGFLMNFPAVLMEFAGVLMESMDSTWIPHGLVYVLL